MSAYRRYRPPLPSTRALTAKIVAVAVAATLAIGVLISIEMASGNDPALGPKATTQTKKSTAGQSGSGTSRSSGARSGTDSYSQYGYGYSYGSSSSGYSSSPPPVTS